MVERPQAQFEEQGDVHLAVLGPLEASRGDAAVTRPSHRRLLAILAHSVSPLNVEQLADRFWPAELPERWKAALHTHVSALRRLLGTEVISFESGHYTLNISDANIDLPSFIDRADAARAASEAAQWDAVIENAEGALRLWRGDPFGDLAYDDFALAEITYLQERHVDVAERRADALLRIGRHEEALPDLEALAREHPIREPVWELLITARARGGRTVEALDAYRDLRLRLRDQGLEPNPRLRELEDRILSEDPTIVGRRAHHNLPVSRTSFIGRSNELTLLADLLAENRLVTLTGVGGSGKTRLALALARDQLEEFSHVYLVELASITEPTLVASAAAVAFGLRPGSDPLQTIRDLLSGGETLCVLDNCEHLVDAAGELAEVILGAGPSTRVLTTSRSPLGLPDEVPFRVPPLPIPAEDATPEEVVSSDAVRLLLERAHLPDVAEATDGETGTQLAELSRHLDGLPLAIELAAARLRSIAPSAVAKKLTRSLDLLTAWGTGRPDRHRTLEATFTWSHDLLTDQQQTVFARLSVFPGRFTLDAAEVVVSDDEVSSEEVIGALIELVECSMVDAQRDSRGVMRYRLLDTVRTFAREQLERLTPGIDELRRRHLAWAVHVAREITADLDRADQWTMLDRLESTRDDLTAAHELAKALADDMAVADLAIAVAWLWSKRGQHDRATLFLSEAIDRVDEIADSERAADLRARLAGIHWSNGREREALREATLARDLLIDAPPTSAKVRAFTEHAAMHMRILQDEPEIAVASTERAIEAARAIGDQFAEAHALRTLGSALARAGNLDEGVARLRHALTIANELDHPSEQLGAYLSLYITLLELVEDHNEAMRVADDAMRWLDRGGERLHAASLLGWIAYGGVKSGRMELTDAALERSERYHLEGALKMSDLAIRGVRHWTAGRLDEAEAKARELRDLPVNPRYYRVLYPLEAEISAARGDLARVHSLVARHLAEDVLDIEQSLKSGTIWPAVRLEVDAAIAATPAGGEHADRAMTLTQKMRSLITRYPPSVPSGFRLELADTYLALAEAELSRLGGSEPVDWRDVVGLPSYLYWRTYARFRLTEALYDSGHHQEGEAELLTAFDDASRLEAPNLLTPIKALAAARSVDLGVVSPST